MRILLVDDHEVVRRGVRSFLRSCPGFEVCGEASDGEQAVEKAQQLRPDIVVMDITMPKMNGLEATREIRRILPKTEVLILSQHDSAEMMREAMSAGAQGYVDKAALTRDLGAALDRLRGVDAAERKRTEAVMEASELRFHEVIDSLPAAIYTTDAEGRLTHFNQAAVEFSGRVPELGTDQWCVTWKLFWPDGRPMAHDECPMAVMLKEGRIVEGMECIAERPDGTRRWFVPYPRPLRDLDGRFVGGMNMLMDITSRKQGEQATNLLASIVDSSDDAIISKNLDGIITSWNHSAERLFGYKAEEAVGRHITLIVPPDRLLEEASILEQLKRGERVDHFETVRARKDGTLHDLSLTISPLKDSSGLVVGASNVVRDIGERKRIAESLRESEERFRAIVETMPECVKLVAPDGTLLHMNSSGLQMVGAQSAAEVVNKSVYDLIAPENREEFRMFNERVCAGEKGSLEFDIVGLEGKRRHMEMHAAPFRNSDGRRVELAITRDISERKQVEERLRQHRERFELMAQASQVGFWFCDLPFDKLRWDDRVKEHFWLPPEAEVSIDTFYERLHPDDRERTRETLAECISRGVPYDIEYRTVAPDGREKWIRAMGRAFYDAAGRPKSFDGLTIDVTERRRAEERERQITAEAVAATA
ncbi:MAG: PAS domain S-box protein, partial [Terriglobales bacterium]